MKSELRYYVYAYLRKSNLSPYYIGKGTKGRKTQTKHSIKIPDDSKRIVIVENNLTNIGALAIERRLIRWYGRLDLGTGILRNLSDGGEGALGYKHTAEAKRKIGDKHRGKIVSKETIEKQKTTKKLNNKPHPMKGKKGKPSIMKGKNQSEEWKLKHSAAQKNRFKDQEQREKLLIRSNRAREKKKENCLKFLVSDTNDETKIYTSIGEYSRINGFLERNIYHLANKYPNKPIPSGRFKGYRFLLVSPEMAK